MDQPRPTWTILTPELEQRILDYAGQGLTGRKISLQPDIEASHQTVNKFLRDYRQARAETTRAIVHEHLSATLPSDLEQLDKLSARLEAMRGKAEGEGLPVLELKVIDQQVKTIALKLKHSGAEEEDAASRLIAALSE